MYVTSEVSTIIAPIVVPLYHALRGISVAKEGADCNRQFWAACLRKHVSTDVHGQMPCIRYQT
mgnify:CR=1 FL=1